MGIQVLVALNNLIEYNQQLKAKKIFGVVGDKVMNVFLKYLQ